MQGAQLIPWPLPDVTWTAGGRASTPLKDFPTRIRGRLPHMVGISWEVDVDPTFTTAPTIVGLNAVVADLKIHDGKQLRFDGNFNYLRVFEALELGRLRQPDPDTNSGSTNNFYFGRYWTPGPANFAKPTDFAMSCASMDNAVIQYTFGALTDISADTTAATVVIRATAWLLLMDDIRIPPVYERVSYAANSKDFPLQGKALYPFLALLNSASVDAIGDGDFGAITVTDGHGEVISAIDAEVLCKAYQAQMNAGPVTPIQGEPRAATDDNGKVVNGASPTALVAATAAIQPVLWSTQGAMISKIVAESENTLRVRWAGSQASGVVLAGRILDQPDTVMAGTAATALNKLGLSPRSADPVTASKKPYKGPRRNFMPHKVSV